MPGRPHVLFSAVLSTIILLALFFGCFSGTAFARTVTITDGSRTMTYTGFATNPSDILGEAGIELWEQDSFTTGPSTIDVTRAQHITLYYYGVAWELSSLGETVEQLLTRYGFSWEAGDVLSHSPSAETRDGMVLRVDRVVSQEQHYATAVPHEVRYCSDPALPTGTSQVLIPGEDGELLRTALVTYTNNLETGRRITGETMTRAPVTELIAQGTGPAPEVPEPELVIEDGFIRLATGEILTYYDTAPVRATAYTHTDEGCDFITYTGSRVRVGTVAVDPRYIPYGTRMFIVSDDGEYIYGISVAEDCGGAIKGDRIDLYFPTYQECIQFGRRDCTIYFLG